MKISELIKKLQEAEKKGINVVKCGKSYIDEVTCEGIGCYIDLKSSYAYGLTLSELIKELHSMRVGYGSDVEVKCTDHKIMYTEVIEDTCYINYKHGDVF